MSPIREHIEFLFTTHVEGLSPDEIADLYAHVSKLSDFVSRVNAAAGDLATAGNLPGYGFGQGKTKPLAWTDAAEANAKPEWFEKKLKTPTQVVKAGLATEEDLVAAGIARRDTPNPIIVKLA